MNNDCRRGEYARRPGRYIFLFLLVLPVLSAALSAQTQPFDHDLWDRVTRQYVTQSGLVRYEKLKAQPGDLSRYVDRIARYSPENAPERFPSKAHELAYWINAYNALIVHRVVENYPVESIRDLGGWISSVFKKKQTVGGKQLSYDDIEHEIIRERFFEPRIHFVLNCASTSCAPLQPHALTAENLEETLQRAAVQFLNDDRNVQVDARSGTVRLSRYFDWFTDDFLSWLRENKNLRRPGALDYVRLYLRPEKRVLLDSRDDWDIRFFDYDWNLNDAPKSPSGTSGSTSG